MGPAIGSQAEPNAWRIYSYDLLTDEITQITGLENVPGSDQPEDLGFNEAMGNFNRLRGYDDTAPQEMPDGRIVFCSTRYPAFSQYGAGRSSNLFVVNADGTNLHRITSEKNGADRPLIDPITGKIVFFRWWRNFRSPYNDADEVDPTGGGVGYEHYLGLTYTFNDLTAISPPLRRQLNHNFWQIASINPDGTDLSIWRIHQMSDMLNTAYGGSFNAAGDLIANFFPIAHLTESAGFGGLRKHPRGAGASEHIIDITRDGARPLVLPSSFGVMEGSYSAEPFVFTDSDGVEKIVFSKAADYQQDYGLYMMSADAVDADDDGLPDDGSLELLHDVVGTTEIQAQVVKPRALSPVITDQIDDTPSLLPPHKDRPYDQDGTFVFECKNIYFNAPIDVPIISAPPVQSVGSLRFYGDFQRDEQGGSFSQHDWPILLDELPIDEWGRVTKNDTPANIPLFEQARSPESMGYLVPITGGGVHPFVAPSNHGKNEGAAHVSGMNYGKPGNVSTCVGCHAGHTLLDIPENPEDLFFTNVAPGAILTASSTHSLAFLDYATDRKVQTSHILEAWVAGGVSTQWLDLEFLAPIWIRKIKLYNPQPGPSMTIVVQSCRLDLYDENDVIVATQTINEDLSPSGTEWLLEDVRAQRLRITFLQSEGQYYAQMGYPGLEEVEIIAASADPANLPSTALNSRLLSFDGKKVGQTAALNWKVENEKAISSYFIERSTDGLNFQRIHEQSAGGNENLQLHYQFTDNKPENALNYYRLAYEKKDGKQSFFSDMVVLDFRESSLEVSVFPNPVQDILNLKVTPSALPLSYSIIDVKGNLVKMATLNLDATGRTTLNWTDLEKGVYKLLIYNENMGIREVIKVVKW